MFFFCSQVNVSFKLYYHLRNKPHPDKYFTFHLSGKQKKTIFFVKLIFSEK